MKWPENRFSPLQLGMLMQYAVPMLAAQSSGSKSGLENTRKELEVGLFRHVSMQRVKSNEKGSISGIRHNQVIGKMKLSINPTCNVRVLATDMMEGQNQGKRYTIQIQYQEALMDTVPAFNVGFRSNDAMQHCEQIEQSVVE